MDRNEKESRLAARRIGYANVDQNANEIKLAMRSVDNNDRHEKKVRLLDKKKKIIAGKENFCPRTINSPLMPRGVRWSIILLHK